MDEICLDIEWDKLKFLLRDGLDDLARAHWREVGVHQDEIPYAPDYEKFQELEDAGMFRILSVRKDDLLIGYSGFMIQPHLHYKTKLHALNDVIYVDKAERGYPGIRLILEAENKLIAMGIRRILYHSKTDLKLGSGIKGAQIDSMDALNDALDLEVPENVEISDALFHKIAVGDATLGDILEVLGYCKFETVYDKIVGI